MDAADGPCHDCPIVRALTDERDQLLAEVARLKGTTVGTARIAHGHTP